MGRIEWTESLSVHIDELDDQHRELIRLYNNLHESLVHDPPEKTAETKIATLDALMAYALLHFATEEKYLEGIGYPDLANHQRLHREFGDKVWSLQQDNEANKPVLGTSMIKFLRNWIIDHISKIDQEYTKFHRQGQG